jgi:hypothetical protein
MINAVNKTYQSVWNVEGKHAKLVVSGSQSCIDLYDLPGIWNSWQKAYWNHLGLRTYYMDHLCLLRTPAESDILDRKS